MHADGDSSCDSGAEAVTSSFYPGIRLGAIWETASVM